MEDRVKLVGEKLLCQEPGSTKYSGSAQCDWKAKQFV